MRKCQLTHKFSYTMSVVCKPLFGFLYHLEIKISGFQKLYDQKGFPYGVVSCELFKSSKFSNQ